MLTVGDEFPRFMSAGVNGGNEIVDVSNEFIEGWAVYYFYPKDFTFICPTEIAKMDKLVDIKDKDGEGVDVFGFSGDNEFCKLNWKKSNNLIANIRHTLVADTGLHLSNELGIEDFDNGVCYRATFIVDPDYIIQHVSVNALHTGRNVKEIIRTLLSLQADGLTGQDWQPGEDFVA